MLKPVLSSQGRVYALPISPRKLARAAYYFKQPVLPDKPVPSGSDWEAGEASLKLLEEFDQERGTFLASARQMFIYLNQHVFKNQDVLQIGCSLGFPQRVLGQDFSGRWVSADYDPLILEHLKKKNPLALTAVADTYHLPFEASSFNVVFSYNFLDVLFDPQKMFLEAMRVLRPGGYILHLLDCLPNKNQIGAQLFSRGYSSMCRHNLGLFSLLSRHGTDTLTVHPTPEESDIDFDDFNEDKLDLLTKKMEKAGHKTSFSLLSMAQLLCALEAVPGISRTENGVLASVVASKAMEIQDYSRLTRALHEHRPFWTLNYCFLQDKINWRSILKCLHLPVNGLQIYAADYVLAEKAA